MTKEEAKEVFLNRGFIDVEGGTVFDGNKWRQAYVTISKWLEQEPCEDAISRQAVNKWIDNDAYLTKTTKCRLEEELQNLSSVNPQESKTGHWIRATFTDLYHCSKCHSTCHQDPKSKDDYCKYCGAKMVELQESEEV